MHAGGSRTAGSGANAEDGACMMGARGPLDESGLVSLARITRRNRVSRHNEGGSRPLKRRFESTDFVRSPAPRVANKGRDAKGACPNTASRGANTSLGDAWDPAGRRAVRAGVCPKGKCLEVAFAGDAVDLSIDVAGIRAARCPGRNKSRYVDSLSQLSMDATEIRSGRNSTFLKVQVSTCSSRIGDRVREAWAFLVRVGHRDSAQVVGGGAWMCRGGGVRGQPGA